MPGLRPAETQTRSGPCPRSAPGTRTPAAESPAQRPAITTATRPLPCPEAVALPPVSAAKQGSQSSGGNAGGRLLSRPDRPQMTPGRHLTLRHRRSASSPRLIRRYARRSDLCPGHRRRAGTGHSEHRFSSFEYVSPRAAFVIRSWWACSSPARTHRAPRRVAVSGRKGLSLHPSPGGSRCLGLGRWFSWPSPCLFADGSLRLR